MKKNQCGFSIIEILAVFIVLGLIAIGGLYVYQTRDKKEDQPIKNSHQTQPEVDSETIIYGTSTFTEQGPADAPTGTRPASATLLVGTEEKVRNVMKPVREDNGNIAYYKAVENDIKSSDSRIIKTAKGDYEFELHKGEDTVCLVGGIREQGNSYKVGNEARVDFTTNYNLIGGCSKLNTHKPSIQIDIHTIGFGSNQLECIPSDNCTELKFVFD